MQKFPAFGNTLFWQTDYLVNFINALQNELLKAFILLNVSVHKLICALGFLSVGICELCGLFLDSVSNA